MNHALDRDIDARMKRTADRPVASGRVTPQAAILYGCLLACASFALLALAVNPLAAVLAMSGFLGYVVVYTIWLKRTTPQNIVIGGAAGAVPPLVGWAAATGGLDWTALYLFAIVFYWTPPHFWALSLLMKDDYAKAGVPMLPVVKGERETRRQILLYTLLLYAVTQLPFCAGAFDGIYLVASMTLGGALHRRRRDALPPRRPPLRPAALPLLAGLPRAAVRRDGGRRAALAQRSRQPLRKRRAPARVAGERLAAQPQLAHPAARAP